MIRFASLGSGSRGNALLVVSGKTRVLIDCGFGIRALAGRLARLGTVPDQLDAVIVTHEHSDHIGGVAALQRRTACPVYLSAGTHAAMRPRHPLNGPVHHVCADTSFSVGDLEIRPFSVPHDARSPLQYVIGDGAVRLGVLTDTGSVTDDMVSALSACEALVLEFNHDSEMLETGPYPVFLKRRIAGPEGHLDNATAAGLLARLNHERLQHVMAAHLSEQNNTRARVAQEVAAVLSIAPHDVCIASQSLGHDWLQIGARL